VVLRKGFSQYYNFLANHSTDCSSLIIIHHSSSGAGTICQTLANVPSGISVTPTRRKLKNYINI
jgi:hypothetical protein